MLQQHAQQGLGVWSASPCAQTRWGMCSCITWWRPKQVCLICGTGFGSPAQMRTLLPHQCTCKPEQAGAGARRPASANFESFGAEGVWRVGAPEVA